MRRACIAVCWAGVLACSPGGDQADTMSLAAIDTLKPDTSAGATTGATVVRYDVRAVEALGRNPIVPVVVMDALLGRQPA